MFSRHPYDPYTVCEMTLVDGDILFDRAKYLEERKKTEAMKKEAAAKKKNKDEIPGGEV